MISYLESTLVTIKEKYETYNSALLVKDTHKKDPTINIRYTSTSTYLTSVNRINLNFIQETQQYNLKINNLSLFGNIGTIYDKAALLDDRVKAHQMVPCVHGNMCKNVLTEKYCKFFHDPADLLKLNHDKLISDAYYAEAIKLIRNFSNTAWLYSSVRSPNTRCIGSRKTLLNDLNLLKTSPWRYSKNIADMKHQVMHDILVLLILNENNLA